MPQAPKDIANYIAMFPEETKDQLLNMQGIIEKAAPKAEPTISYGMPAFKQEKILVYFAGYQKHIGFYPMPSCMLAFEAKLKAYKTSKGAVQFPLDKALPAKLITAMVKFRLKELKSMP